MDHALTVVVVMTLITTGINFVELSRGDKGEIFWIGMNVLSIVLVWPMFVREFAAWWNSNS